METWELEDVIGERPWTGIESKDLNYAYGKGIHIRQWLINNGMSEQKTNELNQQQIAKCYKIKNYFDVVWGNKPKRMVNKYEAKYNRIKFQNGNLNINDLWKDGDLDINEKEPNLPETNPISETQQNISIDPQKIAQAINSAIEPRLDRLKNEIQGSAAAYLLPKLEIKIQDEIKMLGISDETKKAIAELSAKVARETIEKSLPTRIEIYNKENNETKDLGLQHEKFPILLRACNVRNHNGFRLNIWLTGPTGSGKTSSAESVSEALGLDFASDGSLDADYKVLGFRDANGNVISTEFLRVFANGGIYCADEIDNWLPSALLSLNAALANGWVSTPGGKINRHKDFICIACANTWGLGANSDYVGRTRLDAASLDRFQPKISWPYDEKLEKELATDKNWCEIVQNCRRKAQENGLKIIISPRATYEGCALLQEFDINDVADMTISAGLSPEQKKMIGLDQIKSKKEEESIPLPYNKYKDFVNAIENNEKIQAIRIWREAFNVDLYNAKMMVESIINGTGTIPYSTHPSWNVSA